ncbi:MAG: glycosyltransferase family 4 protein [Anaerolineae bacterium]
MNLLYVALKESIPGSHGGAVHVLEVARQLTRRGRHVTAVVRQQPGQPERETLDGFDVIRLHLPNQYLLFTAGGAVTRLARTLAPDVVMERYYTFSGAGLAAAQALHLPSLLEVNAPIVDPPGTAKARADRFLLGWMRRRALAQAQAATRIVTPLAATIPNEIPRDKIREIPWGANVELFDRAALDPARLSALGARLNPQNRPVVTFLGSFRRWHGIREFLDMAQSIAAARADVLFIMIGAGELLAESRAWVAAAGLGERILLTGAVPYAAVPYYLALAQVGVAPFNTSVHPPLKLGFYWSPLKVHEYMALALPVVTIDVYPLNRMVRHEQEGLLYREGDAAALRAHVERLVNDPALVQRLGQAARQRVVEHLSWQKHAELLEGVLNECLGKENHTYVALAG